MTVAIGLVCSDGVLVAADSMASMGHTAAFVSKVHSFPSASLVWVGSGSVYVLEEIEAALTRQLTGTELSKVNRGDRDAIRNGLGRTVTGALKKCYESALPFGMNQGDGSGKHPFSSEVMLLGWSSGKPWFLEVSSDGGMNWKDGQGFSSIGSGGEFATVAHSIVKHHYTPDFDLEVGLMLAYRVIQSTCEVSSMFVGGPVNLAVASDAGARNLTDDEVNKIDSQVEGWKAVERDALRDLRVPIADQVETSELPTLEI
jgi:20S proteasome alpha/beta subunit